MTSLRHLLARAGWAQLALGIGLVAWLGCSPERLPALRAGDVTAPLVDGAVHVVVRANMTTLARSSLVMLGVSARDASVAVVPDDPELMGASGGSVGFVLDDALGASCGADGLCEVGLTVFADGTGDRPPPSSVRLDLTARSGGDDGFAGALLEVEIDGMSPVAATETSL